MVKAHWKRFVENQKRYSCTNVGVNNYLGCRLKLTAFLCCHILNSIGLLYDDFNEQKNQN